MKKISTLIYVFDGFNEEASLTDFEDIYYPRINNTYPLNFLLDNINFSPSDNIIRKILNTIY